VCRSGDRVFGGNHWGLRVGKKRKEKVPSDVGNDFVFGQSLMSCKDAVRQSKMVFRTHVRRRHMICAWGLRIGGLLHCECLSASYEPKTNSFSASKKGELEVSWRSEPRPLTSAAAAPGHRRPGVHSTDLIPRGAWKGEATDTDSPSGRSRPGGQPALFPRFSLHSFLYFYFLFVFLQAIFHATCANFLRDGAKMRLEWAQAPCLCYGNQKFAIYKLLSQCQPSSSPSLLPACRFMAFVSLVFCAAAAFCAEFFC